MDNFIPDIQVADSESVKALNRMPKKFWQCQNSSCAKVVPNPLRWVRGAKTIFACSYCMGETVEIIKEISEDEQMAQYEEALKESDWGHQPC